MRRGELGACRIGGGLRRIELLAGDDLFRNQFAHACKVSLRLCGVGARRRDARVEHGTLPGGILHHRLRLAFDTTATGRRTRRPKVRVGLCELHGVLALVDAHEGGVHADVIVLGHVHRRHVAAHLREHGHQVSIHLCVVGGRMRPSIRPLLDGPANAEQRSQCHQHKDNPAPAARRRLGRGGQRGADGAVLRL